MDPQTTRDTILYCMFGFLALGPFNQYVVDNYAVQLKDNVISKNESVWTICLGIFFIFQNVLPKYVRHDEAERHMNTDKTLSKSGDTPIPKAMAKKQQVQGLDRLDTKKFLTKNYIRLFFHIFFGATEFLLESWIVVQYLYFTGCSNIHTLKLWVIFLDFGHQLTAWLLCRNHDGIFFIRGGNVMLSLTKLVCCAHLLATTSDEQAYRYVNGLLIFTSGFALTRLFAIIAWIIQYNTSIFGSIVNENWYSYGLFGAQLYVFWSQNVLNWLAYSLIGAAYFPHEMWFNKKHGAQNAFMREQTTLFGIASFFLVSHDDTQKYKLMFILMQVYFTSRDCGIWYKRNRLVVQKIASKIKAAATPMISVVNAVTTPLTRTPMFQRVIGAVSPMFIDSTDNPEAASLARASSKSFKPIKKETLKTPVASPMHTLMRTVVERGSWRSARENSRDKREDEEILEAWTSDDEDSKSPTKTPNNLTTSKTPNHLTTPKFGAGFKHGGGTQLRKRVVKVNQGAGQKL